MKGDMAAPIRDVTVFIAIPCVLATVAKISDDHMYIPLPIHEAKHLLIKPNTRRNGINDSVLGVQLMARHASAVNAENIRFMRLRP